MGKRYAYIMIADDRAIFSRTHPAFAIFQFNATMPHYGVEFANAQLWGRKGGDSCFVVA